MNKERRITLIIEGTYPWYRGGVSEWVWQYLKSFPEYAFDIIQVATDPYQKTDLSTALYPIPDQVTSFFRIPPPSQDPSGYPLLNAWFDHYRSSLLPIALKGQLIHVTNTGFAGWLGAIISAEVQHPLLLTEHALYWKEVESGATALECGYRIPVEPAERKRLAQFFQDTAQVVYARSGSTVSVSRINMPEQRRLGAKDPFYIPNGVSGKWIDEYRNPADMSAKLHRIESDILTIGWIGRCAEIKNPLRFFELAEKIREKNPDNVRFIMMLADSGEHDLAEEVVKMGETHEYIELIWNQPSIRYLNSMDALCITSHNESQPLVLFEALAVGALPFGWRVGDADEIFGIFVEKEESADNLSEVLLRLWNDPQSWKKELGQRMTLIREQHTWSTIFAKYRTLFDHLIT